MNKSRDYLPLWAFLCSFSPRPVRGGCWIKIEFKKCFQRREESSVCPPAKRERRETSLSLFGVT